MDKNLFSLVANGLRTVGVRFQELDRDTGTMGFNSKKAYSYVTDMDLAVGDLVVVEVGNEPAKASLKVALVTEVDDGVSIQPNEDIQYKFVVGTFTTDKHDALLRRKDEVEKKLAQAYKENLRRQFAQQFLGGADADMMKTLGYE